MDKPVTPLPGVNSLESFADFHLGSVRVSPSRRILEGPGGIRHLQPKVMLVLLCLTREPGNVVTRRSLFETCWAGTHVGDDSLNRILTALRQAFEAVGGTGFAIETVPRTGYRFVATEGGGSSDTADEDVEAALDRWRLGLPKPDFAEIGSLEAAFQRNGGRAGDWGVLALLLRKAVEYSDSADCGDLASRCENAARKALRLDAGDANARVALTGLAPLFGNWATVRSDLAELLESAPDQPAALHDFAVLEMATGRPSVAEPIIERLIASDRLAATYHYKRMYHLWTLGDLAGAEQAAGRALALWPRHPAVWMARFWTLLFTDRADQALRMAVDQSSQTILPLPVLQFLQRTAELVERRSPSGQASADVSAHIAGAIEMATLGPAHAVAALMSLCALDAVDEAYQVAFGYYLGEGSAPAPLRWNAGDPSITDQHRRVTQPLFVPSGKCLRQDPRFTRLCDGVGLSAYWDRFDIVPDFRASAG